MATTTTSPLMSLVLPVPGPLGQLGPTWATDLNNALTLVDSHDHSPGKGSRVTPAGININSDFSLNSFNLTLVNSVRLKNQTAALSGGTDISCVYVVAGNLYFNNSAGTQIQLTAAGAINVASLGTITGDYSTTSANLNYNNTTKTYSFFQGTPDTTAPANVACGSVSIAEPVAGGIAVTLQVPTGFSGAYSLTLPAALPASNLPLSVSAAGVLSAAQIATAQLADLSVTQAKRAALGEQLSASSGSFVVTGVVAPPTDVTGVNVTITTTGRPVRLELVPAGGSGTNSFLSLLSSVAVTNMTGNFYFVQGAATVVSEFGLRFAPSAQEYSITPACIAATIQIAAGTYTFKLQYSNTNSNGVNVNNVKLLAYEL